MSATRPDELSIEEIHHLLIDKMRVARVARLELFAATGKVLATRRILGTSPARPEEPSSRVSTLRKSARRSWLDYFLFGVEITAIVGFLGLLLTGAVALRNINMISAEGFQSLAPTPTPLIMAVVLPEGHTPPTSPNGAQPNEAEIPPHLQPLVQAFASLPTPIPASNQAVRIQIPAIGVDAPVVQGDGWEQLKKGVAQRIGTPNPGENGNIVMSGHNDVFGEVFRELDRLKPGDIVILFTSQKKYTYVITGSQIVEPTQVDVMNPTLNPTLTLISCYPYLVDTHRIIISAVFETT